jgi:hypothetical protein
MPDIDRHPCAACGYRIHVAPFGSGASCPMCGWIDDYEQLVHPDLTYGSNAGRSLRQAQRDALARHPLDRSHAGDPVRDERWRPLGTDETPVADPHAPASPVCYVGTPDPRDYVPYWRRPRRS